MWIFLLILKWIFIILGILLGLVLLFTALVLCVPVRYRAAGDNHEKIQYSFKVSWLLSIIAVKKKKDSEQIVFSVFGIPIQRMGNEKPVNRRNRRAGFGSAGRKKETKKGQEEENFFQDQKSEEKEKQKKLFISRAIQYNEVCETKQETFETVVSGNKRAA